MKTEIKEYISEVLRILQETFPHKFKHYLELGEDGNLWLWVRLPNYKQSIIFDEETCNNSPLECANEIIEYIIKTLEL